jgi:hypothetical protein
MEEVEGGGSAKVVMEEDADGGWEFGASVKPARLFISG